MKLVLASGSPRRRELLRSVGLEFEVVVSDVAEQPRPGESPRGYVQRLAAEKAAEVSSKLPGAWIIAADTIVCLDDHILEKPRDRQDAIRILSILEGKWHLVYTGLTLCNAKAAFGEIRVSITKVQMAALSHREIEWYVDTGEPMDKAGAYAVQGIGAMLVESIEGNYTNVVGLPLSVLFDMMRKAGISPIRE